MDSLPKGKPHKYKRNFRHFNEREFLDELHLINWDDIVNDKNDANISFTLFIGKIDSLLNEMAPIRKVTKKEIRLEQRPWITKGIYKSMQERDRLLKMGCRTFDPLEKRNIFHRFKTYRNLIVTLLRRSKSNYYLDYFEKYQCDMKKTWDGIRRVLNVSKNKQTNIDHLIYKKQNFHNKY